MKEKIIGIIIDVAAWLVAIGAVVGSLLMINKK